MSEWYPRGEALFGIGKAGSRAPWQAQGGQLKAGIVSACFLLCHPAQAAARGQMAYSMQISRQG